jgi:hypothetical protein
MVGGVPSKKVCASRERQEHSSQTAVCHPSDPRLPQPEVLKDVQVAAPRAAEQDELMKSMVA